MQDKLNQFKERMAHAWDVKMAASVLEWDQETYMPPGGAQTRADLSATLYGVYHELFTDPAMGRLIDDLVPYLDQLDYDSDDASLIRWAQREYSKQARVPADLIMDLRRATSLGMEAWKEAREQDDFARFEPHLERIVELVARQGEYLSGGSGTPYDAMLDYYDPGLNAVYIESVFAALRPEVVKLVEGIVAHRDAVDDRPLRQHFDADKQMAFSREVSAALGYSYEHGRLDTTAHPFTNSSSPYDVRITTRIHDDDPANGLLCTIHETGHALYYQNVAEALYRTPLAYPSSMSVHESQSRFFENVIGRSRAFWRYWYPRLQKHFAPQLDQVDPETFYKALNKSEPSLIRVEADEVTYGLHIMLRFELEQAIFAGQVRVKDLPREWNDRMEAYFGIRPTGDADGVLQDIHWSWGYFGYFPDYLLGSILSVQLWEQMRQDIPGVDAQIEAGQYDDVLGWQRDKIHRHGMKFTFPETVERATGRSLDWQPYINYLRAKYGEIYGL